MATEKRLIDADRLKKVFEDSLEGTYTIIDPKTASVMAGTLIACGILIDEQPTVDAVEVVRCKDCQSWHKQTRTCDEFTTGRLPSGGRIAFVTSPNGYCSFAKRKTGGADNGL